jgi:gas vesicle protein
MSLQERDIFKFAYGFGCGLGAGFLIGLLYAPQAGRRTRRQIVSAVQDGADNIKSKAEDTSDYIHKQTSRLSKETGDLLDRGKAVIENGRSGIESALESSANLYRQAMR